MLEPRIAMVGAGYFAPFHLEGWRHLGVPVLALCDTHPVRLQQLSQDAGVALTYADAQTMFDQFQPTLVDVVLPPAAQAPVVRAALERGIPTICQKPFALDWAQAQELAACSVAHHTPLVVHENFRFMPWFQECKRLMATQFLGRVHGITFRLRPGDGQGVRAYLDRQPYFQTMPQLLVRETAVHVIDAFRYLLGEVEAVTARLRRLNPVIQGEDAGLIIFEFANDVCALFDGNRLNDHVAQDPRRTLGEMWLEGANGVLRLDGDARLWWKPHHGCEAEHAYGATTPKPVQAAPAISTFGNACAALQAHVLAHLASGAPLQNAAHDYLENLRVQAAVYHSHAMGQRVLMADFNPQPSKRK
jgi:D-apiose dehydrogenase